MPLPSPGLLDIHPLNQSLSVFGRQSWWDLLDSVVPFKLRAIPWRTVVMTHGQPTPTVLGGRVRWIPAWWRGACQGTNSTHHDCPNYKLSLQARTNWVPSTSKLTVIEENNQIIEACLHPLQQTYIKGHLSRKPPRECRATRELTLEELIIYIRSRVVVWDIDLPTVY